MPQICSMELPEYSFHENHWTHVYNLCSVFAQMFSLREVPGYVFLYLLSSTQGPLHITPH